MTYTLAGYSLGTVIEENMLKETFIVPMPAYLMDSNETYVFDFGGTQRTINLTGKFTGTLANIQAFISNMNGLIQGHQDIDAGYPKDYVSDLIGTIKVKVLSFEPTWSAGEPGQLYYTIKLIESGTQI